MFKQLRQGLTYANVMSTIAVFGVLGTGGAFAANSIFSEDIVDGEVKSQDIGDGQVKTRDIAENAVGSNKINDRSVKNADLSVGASASNTIRDGGVEGVDIADDSVTGDDVDESTLAGVYERTILVSPKGSDAQSGDALRDAVAAMSDASGQNPYLVKVEPGVYDLGTEPLEMKAHVDVEGSGANVTTITGDAGTASDGAGGVLVVRGNVRFGPGSAPTALRELTALNEPANAFAPETAPGTRAIEISSGSPTIEAVVAKGEGSENANTGILINGANRPTIRLSRARGTPGFSPETGADYGVEVIGPETTVDILGSSVFGLTTAIRTAGSETVAKVAYTELVARFLTGPFVESTGGSSARCVAAFNSRFDPLDGACALPAAG